VLEMLLVDINGAVQAKCKIIMLVRSLCCYRLPHVVSIDFWQYKVEVEVVMFTRCELKKHRVSLSLQLVIEIISYCTLRTIP